MKKNKYYPPEAFPIPVDLEYVLCISGDLTDGTGEDLEPWTGDTF